MKTSQKVIGLMSGTSLDGLDICYAVFERNAKNYTFHILEAETVLYSHQWKHQLQEAFHSNGEELDRLDKSYGELLMREVEAFIAKHRLAGEVDVIGSHGHTVFHEPQRGKSLQIGNGQMMANGLNIPIVNDFRSKDIALGGQGAPLVPIGDAHLFWRYQACLNLGGMANISFDLERKRRAFDICPANLPLNQLVQERLGLPYDRGGEIARSGNPIPDLIDQLDRLTYYQRSFPKSLGAEWLNKHFYPLLHPYKTHAVSDLLRSIVEHETNQIARVLRHYQLRDVLVSGGGALHTFFIHRLQEKSMVNIIRPSRRIIEFKEALIFGFLAVLRMTRQVNVLASVTGASSDSSSGRLWLPNEPKKPTR